MHGLINRSIQCFVRDTYGEDIWRKVAEQAEVGVSGFEAMLTYDDRTTQAVIDATAEVLHQDQCDFLESLGTYLVAHKNMRSVRRLLRFGGENFEEFLLSLDELPDRIRMTVPDLEFPKLEVTDFGHGQFVLRCIWARRLFDHVVVGILRGMADDYGALVLLDHTEVGEATEVVDITIAESSFAEGRSFQLSHMME